MSELYKALDDSIRSRLEGLPIGEARDAVVATWDGYITATMEWGHDTGYPVDWSQNRLLMRRLKEASSPNLPHLDLYGDGPDVEEEQNLAMAEKSDAESEAHPQHRITYWGARARIRAFLRAASSEVERRALALAWSGYVVRAEEAGLMPPGHAARLMAELSPRLRPGDPWEDIARDRGLDPAALASKAAGDGPWRDGPAPLTV